MALGARDAGREVSYLEPVPEFKQSTRPTNLYRPAQPAVVKNTVSQPNFVDESHLMPKERMELRKKREAD